MAKPVIAGDASYFQTPLNNGYQGGIPDMPNNGFGDLLAQQQQGRMDFMNQFSSPNRRRTVGGGLVDENAPTGLDWLAANNRTGGQSWEQPGVGLSVDPGELLARQMMANASRPQVQFTEGGGRFMSDPRYGTGSSALPRGDAPVGPMLAADRQGIQQSLQQQMARRQFDTVGQRELARRQATGYQADNSWADSPQAAAPTPKPTNATAVFRPPTQAGPDRSGEQRAQMQRLKGEGEDYYQGMASSAPPTTLADIQEMNRRVMNAGNPAILPKLGRAVPLAAAGIWDLLADPLWRSGSNNWNTSQDVQNWLSR